MVLAIAETAAVVDEDSAAVRDSEEGEVAEAEVLDEEETDHRPPAICRPQEGLSASVVFRSAKEPSFRGAKGDISRAATRQVQNAEAGWQPAGVDECPTGLRQFD